MRITEIFKPQSFSSHATRLHTRLTELLLAFICFVLRFYGITQSVQRTFLKYSAYILEDSIGTSFVFMYNLRSCCVYLCCAFVVYRFHAHSNVVVDLLITSSMYISVSVAFVVSFFMLNDIRSFPFA